MISTIAEKNPLFGGEKATLHCNSPFGGKVCGSFGRFTKEKVLTEEGLDVRETLTPKDLSEEVESFTAFGVVAFPMDNGYNFLYTESFGEVGEERVIEGSS